MHSKYTAGNQAVLHCKYYQTGEQNRPTYQEGAKLLFFLSLIHHQNSTCVDDCNIPLISARVCLNQEHILTIESRLSPPDLCMEYHLYMRISWETFLWYGVDNGQAERDTLQEIIRRHNTAPGASSRKPMGKGPERANPAPQMGQGESLSRNPP